jgi:hypothetical protein
VEVQTGHIVYGSDRGHTLYLGSFTKPGHLRFSNEWDAAHYHPFITFCHAA